MVWHARLKAIGVVGVVAVGACMLLGGATGAAALSGAPTFWKVDLHQHSAFSGDARADINLDATIDKSKGYNAVFLTDHDRLSSFQIAGANGNFLSYSEALSTRFLAKTAGTGSTPAVVTTQHHGGTQSLHLSATSATASNARSYVYADRGAGLNSGNVTLDFWVLPQVINAGSGVDVSVSLGGDSTTGTATYGYTNQAGTATPGKSTVLVWQLGSARAASSNGMTDIYTSALGFTAGVWNHYVVNVTTGSATWTPLNGSPTTTSTIGLNQLPAADKPAAYDVLGYVKMEASAVNGTADAYFDDYSLSAASPQCPAAEFAYRNGLIDSGQFNTSTFKLFPAREMGQNNHSNQFNFDIQNANQYKDSYSGDPTQNDATLCATSNATWVPPWQFSYLGTDNIPDVQATGYPVQDNHPGVTDTTADVISSNAHGADAVEVRTGADYSTTWDAILQKDYPIVGTYGSDAHAGVGTGAPSTYIDASSLTLDDLMHSLFEGRIFLAPNNFSGQIAFNLDGSSSPYPGRYPVYVPAGQTSASVHLGITGGLVSGEQVVWYYNSGAGDTAITDPVSGSTYTVSKTIPLSGSFTYVRAAVLSSSGALIANTEPIFFRDVTALPSGTSLRVDSFTGPSGTCSCTIAKTQGIDTASYSAGNLNVTLTNLAGTTVDLVGTSSAPSSVKMDGSSIAQSDSLGSFETATGDAWFYDSGARALYLQDKQSGGTSTIVIALTAGANLPPTANPVSINATSGSSAPWTPNVSDPNGDLLTCSIVAQPTHGAASVASDCSSGNYASDAGYTGPDSFTYKANDGTVDSPAATVSVAVSSGGGGGPIAFVQQKTANGNAVTLPVALNSPSSATNALVASIAIAAGSSASVTGIADTGGGSWTKGPVGLLTGSNTRIELWYRLGGPSASTVTVTLSAAKAAAINLSEWSGVATASAFDASAIGGNASSTTAATPALGTHNPSDLVIGAVNYPTAATSTLGAGKFTGLSDFNYSTSLHGRAAYALTSSNGSFQASWSLSAVSVSGSAILALEAGSGGGGNTPPTAGPVSFNASSGAVSPWTPSVSDPDSGDTLTCSIVSQPAHGTASVASDCSSGSYTSNGGYTGPDTFTYSVNDGHVDSAAATADVTVTSGGGGGSGTFTPIADSYVNADVPTANHGTSTTLRVDSSPVTTSYVRFNVSGLSGPVTSVVLKVWTNSALNAGFLVDAVSNDTWGETTITSANAPPLGSQIGSSGPVAAGSYVSITLSPSFVSGDGDVDLGLFATSTTSLSMGSRESANRPQLIVTTS